MDNDDKDSINNRHSLNGIQNVDEGLDEVPERVDEEQKEKS